MNSVKDEATKKSQVIDLLGDIDKRMLKWYGSSDSQNLLHLRERIFTVHAMVDRQLNLLAMDYLFRTIQPEQLDCEKLIEKDYVKWSDLMGGMMEAFDTMQFKTKLVFAKKLNVINAPTFKVLDDFNKLRNNIGHYKRNYDKIDEYVEALVLMRDAAIFCDDFGFKWFDELDSKVRKSKKGDKD